MPTTKRWFVLGLMVGAILGMATNPTLWPVQAKSSKMHVDVLIPGPVTGVCDRNGKVTIYVSGQPEWPAIRNEFAKADKLIAEMAPVLMANKTAKPLKATGVYVRIGTEPVAPTDTSGEHCEKNLGGYTICSTPVYARVDKPPSL